MPSAHEFLSLQVTEYGLIDWNLFYPEWFVYTAEILALPARVSPTNPGTGQDNTQIQPDAPFLWLATSIEVYLEEFADLDPTTSLPYPPTQYIADVRGNFLDSSINSNLFSTPIPIRHIGGQSASDKVYLDVPRILGKTTSLTTNLFNYGETEIPRVSISFYGVKAKPRSVPVSEILLERMQTDARLQSSLPG